MDKEKRNLTETIIDEPVECAYMDYARRGWVAAYIMTAIAGVAVGLCAWMVGVVV